MDLLTVISTVAGGLGLFLLAVGMMTDGLKLAAGPALRKVLSEWSRTPLRGVFSGFFMTAIVQSSSAVTVASIGFVNAGLLNMRQALGIVYGANVGTTMTAWLVAFVGFKFNVQAFALPLIGLGMLIKITRPTSRMGSLGWVMVGFGLFFVGIDILKTAFEGMVIALDIASLTAEGFKGLMTFFLLGVGTTVLVQSSSATIALTISAAMSGIIDVYAAAAMVIGANIGTTSTAVLASLGATSPAKRVAAAQVIFNVGTALVAFILLPVLVFSLELFETVLGAPADPSTSLALFHSVFNILGVILIFPLNKRLAEFLEQRFLSWEEKESHPRFLDSTVGTTPVLAVNALAMELDAIAARITSLAEDVIKEPIKKELKIVDEVKVIQVLSREVSKFIVNIQSLALSEQTVNDLTTLMRIDQYLLNCALSSRRLAEHLRGKESIHVVPLNQNVDAYFKDVLSLIELDWRGSSVTEEQVAQLFHDLQVDHDQLKANLLLEATRARIPVSQMSDMIDCISEGTRLAQQWSKAIIRLKPLRASLGNEGEQLPPAEPLATVQNKVEPVVSPDLPQGSTE
jgi:phosphate:Na+ symporter